MAQKIFTRELFRKVKKMDRTQRESFVINIYKDGYQDGEETAQEAAAGKEIDMETLQIRISWIRGIGEKKTEEIMKVIKEYMEETR